MGSMAAIAMAVAAASCITVETIPSPQEIKKVNRVTLSPAY